MQLRRLFRVVNGGTPRSNPENWDGDIPWATPVDLGAANGGYLGQTARSITSSGLATGSAAVPPGSLIVSTRAPIGYVVETTMAMAFNQGCHGLVPTRRLSIRYFRYLLLAQAPVLAAYGQGSTFLELSSDGLASLEVLAPSTVQQDDIADYLDRGTGKVDRLTRLREQQAAVLDERLQVLRDEWVRTQYARWGRVPLRRMLSSIEQGWSPQCDAAEAAGDEWGVIKTSAVSSGSFRPAENKTLPPEITPDRRWIIRDGDLLMVRGSGSAGAVGQVAVANTEGRHLMLCDLVYRLIPKGPACPQYLAAALTAPAVRSYIEGAIRSDVGLTLKLRGDDVRMLPVPSAPASKQHSEWEALAEMCRTTQALALTLNAQSALLRERRLALIVAAVTGELRIPKVTA